MTKTGVPNGEIREKDLHIVDDLGNLQKSITCIAASSISLPESATFRDVFNAMLRNHDTVTGIVLFVNEKGELSGLLTYRDLCRLLSNIELDAKAFPHATPRAQAQVMEEGDTILYLLSCMCQHTIGHRHVPLIDSNGKPVGVYLVRELLPATLKYLRKDETVADAYLGIEDDLLASKNDSFETILTKLNASRQRAVLVTDQDSGKILGIITEWDVILCYFSQKNVAELESCTAETLMTRTPETCSIDDSLRVVNEGLTKSGHHQLPVLDEEGAVVGLIFARSILDFIVEGELQQVLCASPTREPSGEAAGA